MKENKNLNIFRVQKAVALSTGFSRRKAEELIKKGRVRINKKVASVGQIVDLKNDLIELDEKPLFFNFKLHYLILNKPRGYVSTFSDELGRKTVFSLLKGFSKKKLFIVGRLDKNSEGLILLTNDGELAFRVMHPRFKLEKEYLIEINGVPDKKIIRKVEEGVDLEEGRTAPAKVKFVKVVSDKAWLRMILREGRKREIRRIWRKLGFTVLSLKRERIGPLKLGSLKIGKWRKLSQREVFLLRQSVGLEKVD